MEENNVKFISVRDVFTENEIIINANYIIAIQKAIDLENTEIYVALDRRSVDFKKYTVLDSIKTIKAKLGILK